MKVKLLVKEQWVTDDKYLTVYTVYASTNNKFFKYIYFIHNMSIFLESKVKILNIYTTNRAKPKHIQCTIKLNRQMQLIVIFEQLELKMLV